MMKLWKIRLLQDVEEKHKKQLLKTQQLLQEGLADKNRLPVGIRITDAIPPPVFRPGIRQINIERMIIISISWGILFLVGMITSVVAGYVRRTHRGFLRRGFYGGLMTVFSILPFSTALFAIAALSSSLQFRQALLSSFIAIDSGLFIWSTIEDFNWFQILGELLSIICTIWLMRGQRWSFIDAMLFLLRLGSLVYDAAHRFFPRLPKVSFSVLVTIGLVGLLFQLIAFQLGAKEARRQHDDGMHHGAVANNNDLV